MGNITKFENYPFGPETGDVIKSAPNSLVTTRAFGTGYSEQDFIANINAFLPAWASSGFPLQVLSQPDFPHLDALRSITQDFAHSNPGSPEIYIDLAPVNTPEISFSMLNVCRIRALEIGAKTYITNSTDIYPTPEDYKIMPQLALSHPSVIGVGKFLDGVHSRDLVAAAHSPDAFFQNAYNLLHNNALNVAKTRIFPADTSSGNPVTVLDVYSHFTDNRGPNSKWETKQVHIGKLHKIGGNEDTERLLRVLLADQLWPQHYPDRLDPVVMNLLPTMLREGKEVVGYPDKLARRAGVVSYYLNCYVKKLAATYLKSGNFSDETEATNYSRELVQDRMTKFLTYGVFWVTPIPNGSYNLYNPAFRATENELDIQQLGQRIEVYQQLKANAIADLD